MLAARAEGRVVGVAVLAYRLSISAAGPFASIEDLYVEPGARGGVGRALLEAVEERCVARGVSYVEAQVEDEEAQHSTPRSATKKSPVCACTQVLHFRAGSLAHVSKPSISLWFLAGRHARLVVLGEDLTDEFSAAAHSHLVEDGLGDPARCS